MMDYYDREGKPITLAVYIALLKNDPEYKRVDLTILPDGKVVSTVHLGLDHGYGHDTPLIFETMVFASKDSHSDLDCERYSTLEQAKAGHARMVEKWTNGDERSES